MECEQDAVHSLIQPEGQLFKKYYNTCSDPDTFSHIFSVLSKHFFRIVEVKYHVESTWTYPKKKNQLGNTPEDYFGHFQSNVIRCWDLSRLFFVGPSGLSSANPTQNI